ncbi:MAG: sensor histidine kinase [Nitrosomonadales bacterium]|nr:sensor histidine kinase [Nitrosomonadales bacterium]
MQLVDALRSGAIHLPWPVSVKEGIFDGHNMHQSSVCQKKCGNTPACTTTFAGMGEGLCTFGMSYFQVKVKECLVTIFGVRSLNNPNTSKPHLKDALKGRLVNTQQVQDWANKTASLLTAIDGEFLRRQSELLDPLHDSIRLGRQIESIANRLVTTDTSRSLEEQVDQAPPDLKSLVKAAGLLTDSFDLLTIYFNPAAASFGRKSYISLHGLLRKLVSILSNPDYSEENGQPVRIFLNGECRRNVSVYESFKLVPFALISNAVKYTTDGKVHVSLVDRAGVIEVSVTSIGPLIEPEELELIFTRRFRGKWAKKMATGSGVGLHLAKIVADANGFAIHVTSSRHKSSTNENPLATNKFSFEITS